MEQANQFFHHDTLGVLNGPGTLAEKLNYIHEIVNARFDFVQRMAVAVYDAKTDLLKTFIHSSGDRNPLRHYQAPLARAGSLRQILESGRPRVVNDLQIFSDSQNEHARRILAEGYNASYTMPMYQNGEFFGFVFFNSRDKNVFTDEVLHYLDLLGHLLSLTVINELANLRTLEAALQTACDLTHHRDNETGSHLDRMSRYARIIARGVAPEWDLSDEFVEHVFMFSPLHDIGKLTIPDDILLKPAKLTAEEFELMKTHTERGRELIDKLIQNFGLDSMRNIDLLRNIAQHHHECMHGSGYPAGIEGEHIPLESRIVAVADVFDALTSARPYKEAWDNERAFATLEEMAASDCLDRECVQALIGARDEVERIQQRFGEDPLG